MSRRLSKAAMAISTAIVPADPVSDSRPASSPEGNQVDDRFALASGSSTRASTVSHEDAERRLRKRALKALTDAVKEQTANLGVGSRFTRVPSELLLQPVLRLQPWAVLVTDETIFELAHHNKKVHARKALLRKMSSTRGAVARFIHSAGRNQGELAGGRRFEGTLHLDITGAAEVSDRSIAALASVCHTLQFLSLAGCSGLTDAGIHAICTANKDLLCLNINGSGAAYPLNGTAAEAIGSTCHSLRELHLRRCTWLRPWMCMRLFTGCPQLEVIDLSFVTKLSDAEVTSIAKVCPQLRHVDLRECVNLSDAAVMALTQGCPGLRYLALSRKDQKYKVRRLHWLWLWLLSVCPLVAVDIV